MDPFVIEVVDVGVESAPPLFSRLESVLATPFFREGGDDPLDFVDMILICQKTLGFAPDPAGIHLLSHNRRQFGMLVHTVRWLLVSITTPIVPTHC